MKSLQKILLTSNECVKTTNPCSLFTNYSILWQPLPYVINSIIPKRNVFAKAGSSNVAANSLSHSDSKYLSKNNMSSLCSKIGTLTTQTFSIILNDFSNWLFLIPIPGFWCSIVSFKSCLIFLQNCCILQIDNFIWIGGIAKIWVNIGAPGIFLFIILCSDMCIILCWNEECRKRWRCWWSFCCLQCCMNIWWVVVLEFCPFGLLLRWWSKCLSFSSKIILKKFSRIVKSIMLVFGYPSASLGNPSVFLSTIKYTFKVCRMKLCSSNFSDYVSIIL